MFSLFFSSNNRHRRRLVGELGEILLQGEPRESRSSRGALQVNGYHDDCRSASLQYCLFATPHPFFSTGTSCADMLGGGGVKERSINTCLLYFINRIIQLHSHMHLVKNSVHQATACKDITKTTGPVESLLLAKTQFTLDLTWSIQVIYLKKKVNPHAAMYDPEIEREEMQ